MKPNEFDNLIRSKFDENDFEYNPGNWEQLVARMDDKPGKRRTFLWVPMAIIASTASIAASLAMIITIPALMHHKAGAPIASVRHHADVPAKSNAIADMQPTFVPVVPAAVNDINNLAKTFNSNTNNRKDNSLSLRAAFDANVQAARANRALLAFNAAIDDDQVKIEEHSNYPVYNTFYSGPKPDNRNAKTTLSIAGGLNYGNSISGYSIGATGKRMLGDHFYIESDLAFVNDNTTEKSEYWVVNNIDSRAIASRMIANDFSSPAAVTNNLPSVAVPVSGAANSNSQFGSVGSGSSTPVRAAAAKMVLPVTGNISPSASASSTASLASFSNKPFARPAMAGNNNNATVRRYAGAKMTSSGSSSTERIVETAPTPAASTVQEREVNYNLYYAQVTPTLGYNIHKKISVGVGADVQRLLLNETSTTSGADVSQLGTREVPAFDLGLVGKAECALSSSIKAGVSYRQGMNNIVAPNGNYLDRNYVQVQLKFLLLKK